MVRVKKTERKRKYVAGRREQMDFAEIERLARWFATGAHSDLTIISGGQNFKVHKFQLALRSKYFETLLYGNFEEKSKDEIELVDDDPSALHDVLEYMYTYQYEPSKRHPNPLLHHLRVAITADKYGMADLTEEALERFTEDAGKKTANGVIRFAEAAQMVYENDEYSSFRPHIVKLANVTEYRTYPDKYKAIWNVIDTSTSFAADLLRDPELMSRGLKRNLEDEGIVSDKRMRTEGFWLFSDDE